MTFGQLRVERCGAGAAPAALVAVWLLGELLDLPDATVTLDESDTILVSPADPGSAPQLRARLTTTMTEGRFAGWRLSTA